MSRPVRAESGQAAFLFLGVLAALLAGTLVLFGFGQARLPRPRPGGRERIGNAKRLVGAVISGLEVRLRPAAS